MPISELVTTISTAITAFSASNFDDLIILMLFFSEKKSALRTQHIIIGQYLGCAVLVIASLPGFFSSFILPEFLIKLLALIPIAKGVMGLFKLKGNNNKLEQAEIETELSHDSSVARTVASFISPQTYTVAAVQVAEGGDSISTYVPLFANSTLENLLVILSVFFILVGVWCIAAYRLTHQQKVAYFLTRYGNIFVPPAFIVLGFLILFSST